jgi:hypothetical protein
MPSLGNKYCPKAGVILLIARGQRRRPATSRRFSPQHSLWASSSTLQHTTDKQTNDARSGFPAFTSPRTSTTMAVEKRPSVALRCKPRVEASFLGLCAPYIWTFLNSLFKIEFFKKN